jgi:ATP-dependent DNA helicase RecG
MEGLVQVAYPHIQETLPLDIIQRFNLISKQAALKQIHFPENPEILQKARFRLKFEEFFFVQLRLLKLKLTRTEKSRGQILNQTELLTKFYKEHLPFELTEAQKRVVREAFGDMKSGKQMNRLIQGDVGSGKTMVAFICILIAVSSGAQTCLMAPTEILANQHHEGLKEYADLMGLKIALLTGSAKKSTRKIIHEMLLSGDLHIIIGTHALLEDIVQFKNLGWRLSMNSTALVWHSGQNCGQKTRILFHMYWS